MLSHRFISTAATILAFGVPWHANAQYDRYGDHRVQSPPPVPACDAAHRVVCLVDSTRSYSDDCCASISSSKWLIMATGGDSLEFYARAVGLDAYLSIRKPDGHFAQENLGGMTAPFVRLRVPESGAYVLTVDLDPLDSAIGLPYELRVWTEQGRSPPVSSPILSILGNDALRVAVRPHTRQTRSSREHTLSVRPGVYRVYAPGIDSLEVCRIPCRTPTVVALRSADVLSVRP